MATSADLLTDVVGRISEHVRDVADGLSEEQLAYRHDGRANSIAWLVWHQARVMDDHVADAAGTQQVWTAHDWVSRFDLPLERADTGYGHTSEQVAKVRAGAELLTGYADAATEAMTDYVRGLSDSDLDRVVDENWDPPVTLAVRLVSVLDDCVQHLGQAAFARGLLPE
ncbi:MAG: DinB family protein [Actinomycetota bacterium]|nr:DinB family protein [Actinomycetota bacterium]